MPRNASLYDRIFDLSQPERVAALRSAGFPVAERTERVELKVWARGTLTQPMYFLHGSSVTPQQITDAGGLNPDFSKEVCLFAAKSTVAEPARDVTFVGNRGGRLVLACQTFAPVVVPKEPGDNPNPRAQRVSARLSKVIIEAGFLPTPPNPLRGYAYILRIPASPEDPWTYFSANGMLNTPDQIDARRITTGEVAFDRPIPLECMRMYTDYTARVRDGAKEDTFLEVAWEKALPETWRYPDASLGAHRPPVPQ